MASVHPYLNFAGNTEEAFNFYKSVFGGEFQAVMRFGETPGCDESPISENEKQKIAHIALPLGTEGTMLMATDSLESMGQKLMVGNNYSIAFCPDSKDEADRLFKALGDGGNVIMPIGDTFWGSYWGCLTDKFGINWMIDYDTSRKSS